VGEIRYAYSNLVGNPEEDKETLVTTCPMWEDNIKMDSKEIGYVGFVCPRTETNGGECLG
jgi:hypothetical protein